LWLARTGSIPVAALGRVLGDLESGGGLACCQRQVRSFLRDFLMKTTVQGVRLTDYQLECLQKVADRLQIGKADVIRLLVEMLVDGVIVL